MVTNSDPSHGVCSGGLLWLQDPRLLVDLVQHRPELGQAFQVEQEAAVNVGQGAL